MSLACIYLKNSSKSLESFKNTYVRYLSVARKCSKGILWIHQCADIFAVQLGRFKLLNLACFQGYNLSIKLVGIRSWIARTFEFPCTKDNHVLPGKVVATAKDQLWDFFLFRGENGIPDRICVPFLCFRGHSKPLKHSGRTAMASGGGSRQIEGLARRVRRRHGLQETKNM